MKRKITATKVIKALTLIFAKDPAELELLSEFNSISELDFDELDDFIDELDDFIDELELLSSLELLSDELELLTGSGPFMNVVIPQNSSDS